MVVEAAPKSVAAAPRRMTLGAMLAYGSGDFYGGGSLYIMTTLYVFFLTVIVGMPPLYSGTIGLVGKVWAGIANPLMGYVTDHTKSRWGRRRVWFLAGLIPSFAVLWIPLRFSSDGATFAFHLAMYLVFSTFFTIVKVPYNSILSEMTSDYGERSRATGFRMFFSYSSNFVGAILPLTIVGWCGGGGTGYLVMGIVFGILFTIPWIFEFLYTWERDVVVPPRGDGVLRSIADLFRAFASTMRNRTFCIHMAMYLTAFTNLDIVNGLFIFYVTLSLGHDADTARNVMSVVAASPVFALPLVTVACYRFGNAATYRASLLLWGFGIVSFANVPAGAPMSVLYVCAVLIGLGQSGAIVTPWNIQSFMPDVDELITQQRREGVYAGFMQFARQVAAGLALFGTNLVLAAMGFVKGNAMQPPEVGVGIRWFMLLSPVIFLGSGILFSFLFKLDPRNHAVLLGEIERLRGGGRKEDVSPEVRAVCERLTGQPYEQLWRRTD